MGSLRSFTSTRHCIKHPTFTHVIARICVQRNCRELNCGCNVKMTRPKNTYWATNYNFKKIHDDNFSIRYASIDLNIYTITFIQVLLLFLWGILWFRLWYFCWCGWRWCQSLVRGVFRDNSCGTSFGKNGSYRIDNSYSWKEKTNMGLEIVFCNFCGEECLKTSLNSSLHIHSSILFAFFLFRYRRLSFSRWLL